MITKVLAATLLLASGTMPAVAQPTRLQQCLKRFNANACQLPRSGVYAYDCAYNQKPLACAGLSGSTIRWADGVVTHIQFVREATDADRKRLRSLGLDDSARALYTDASRGNCGNSCFRMAIPPGLTR